jgi:5-formyltetrahydrofolate cyclo-ligase
VETTAEKIELRERMRAMLATMPASQVRVKSAAIWERLSVLPELASASWLLVYVSKGREVDTHGLIQQLLAMGRHVCVPKFDESTQQYLISELRDFASELVEGKFRILEPRTESIRAVEAGKLEAFVVPGLAFDAAGHRLGRGMGYFDRILRDARQPIIGLAYDFQILEEIPVESHDVCVDFVVTETRTLNCQRKSS